MLRKLLVRALALLLIPVLPWWPRVGWAAVTVITSVGLRFVAPSRVRVTAAGSALKNLNELEYVKGEVFANVWQTDYVARIDPASGKVNGYIDLRGLLTDRERESTDVLNGIAYDDAGDRLFITGKLWPRVFEVRITRK